MFPFLAKNKLAFSTVKAIVLITLLATSNLLFSQRASNIWYFGQNAGLDFSTTPPSVISGLANMNDPTGTGENVSSISNKEGEHLFSIITGSIYDHELEKIADLPKKNTHKFGLQSTFIVPVPQTVNEYYISVLPSSESCTADSAIVIRVNVDDTLGLNFIDTTYLAGYGFGQGQLIVKKMDGNSGSYSNNYWLILKERNSNGFIVYTMDNSGVTFEKEIFVGPDFMTNCGVSSSSVHCVFKQSSCGDLFSVAFSDSVRLYTLDEETATISFLDQVEIDQLRGIEFSSNGKFIFASTGTNGGASNLPIYKIPISNSAFETPTQIGSMALTRGGAMQLGPDGKIYISGLKDWSGVPKESHLGVISDADNGGVLDPDGIVIPNSMIQMGLTSFPAFMVNNSARIQGFTTCVEDVNTLSNSFSGELAANPNPVWKFYYNDFLYPLYTSNDLEPSYVFDLEGTYNVSLSLNNSCGIVQYDTVSVNVRDNVAEHAKMDSVGNGEYPTLDCIFYPYGCLWYEYPNGEFVIEHDLVTSPLSMEEDSLCYLVELNPKTDGPFTVGYNTVQGYGLGVETAEFDANKDIVIDEFSLKAATYSPANTTLVLKVSVKQGNHTLDSATVSIDGGLDQVKRLVSLDLQVPKGEDYILTIEGYGNNFFKAIGTYTSNNTLINIKESGPLYDLLIHEADFCTRKIKVCSYLKGIITSSNKVDESKMISALPNPSYGEFVISTTEEMQYEIHDINGRLIKLGVCVDQQLININQKGVYILKALFKDNSVIVEKLVVN